MCTEKGSERIICICVYPILGTMGFLSNTSTPAAPRKQEYPEKYDFNWDGVLPDEPKYHPKIFIKLGTSCKDLQRALFQCIDEVNRNVQASEKYSGAPRYVCWNNAGKIYGNFYNVPLRDYMYKVLDENCRDVLNIICEIREADRYCFNACNPDEYLKKDGTVDGLPKEALVEKYNLPYEFAWGIVVLEIQLVAFLRSLGQGTGFNYGWCTNKYYHNLHMPSLQFTAKNLYLCIAYLANAIGLDPVQQQYLKIWTKMEEPELYNDGDPFRSVEYFTFWTRTRGGKRIFHRVEKDLVECTNIFWGDIEDSHYEDVQYWRDLQHIVHKHGKNYEPKESTPPRVLRHMLGNSTTNHSDEAEYIGSTLREKYGQANGEEHRTAIAEQKRAVFNRITEYTTVHGQVRAYSTGYGNTRWELTQSDGTTVPCDITGKPHTLDTVHTVTNTTLLSVRTNVEDKRTETAEDAYKAFRDAPSSTPSTDSGATSNTPAADPNTTVLAESNEQNTSVQTVLQERSSAVQGGSVQEQILSSTSTTIRSTNGTIGPKVALNVQNLLNINLSVHCHGKRVPVNAAGSSTDLVTNQNENRVFDTNDTVCVLDEVPEGTNGESATAGTDSAITQVVAQAREITNALKTEMRNDCTQM